MGIDQRVMEVAEFFVVDACPQMEVRERQALIEALAARVQREIENFFESRIDTGTA